jgi:Protein kinase domain
MADTETFDANLRAALEPAYRLERELVGGGMSRVFLATERALNRSVVIKVLPPELAAGVNRERFRREIQLAAQLQHPHIVPLYSAGEHGDMLFYTMPFIEGESLKHAIHERKGKSRFTPREVVGVLHDVVDALAYAHARGVVHRDIKPGNVLRSGRHAVVTDFGVAKAISASMPSVGATTSGMAIGTPAYMAPEQLAGDPAADHRMDIYAVGLLGYELLAGEAPFNEISPQATMAAQLTRSPEPLANSREDVPPQLSALIMKCLEKNPSARPQTAAELLVELDALAFISGDYFPPARPARKWGAAIAIFAVTAAIAFVVRSGTTSNAAPAAITPVATKAAAPPPRATPSLTRAESLAIATAVESRMATRTVAAPSAPKIDSATLAAIRNDVEKSVLDSLQKMRPPEPSPDTRGARGGQRFTGAPDFSGMTRDHIDSIVKSTFGGRGVPGNFTIPPRGSSDRAAFDARMADMGPARHVIVADPPPDRQHPELQTAGVQVMDALRKQLAGGGRYLVVNHDSTAAALARTRSRDSVMTMLGGDMNVSIRPFPSPRADSVRWIVTLFDPTSQGRSQTVTVGPVPSNSTAINDSIAKLAVRALWQLDHMPRRRAPASAPKP